MSNLYYYYQKHGGEEVWAPIQASLPKELEKIKPTFTTILALDTLLDAKPSRDVLEKVKYQGPMYFDLDAEDIQDSIDGAKKLAAKLLEFDLTEEDFDIFLSGKKGFHFLIAQSVFWSKPVPAVKLPAVYKELAFNLIVETLDMKVYTARRGRMFRTCFNIRENGNYKVPILLDELNTITPESYSELCKSPRILRQGSPSFRFKLAIEFDKAVNKVPKVTARKAKTYSPQMILQHWPSIENVFAGVGLTEDLGFNKIAIQVALYAREAGWTEDQFLEKTKGLVANHLSDGSRYNSDHKRQAELVRMFAYVDDNAAYEYNLQGVKSLLKKVETTAVDSETGESVSVEPQVIHNAGVEIFSERYWVKKSEDEFIPISNFLFESTVFVRDLTNGTTISMVSTIKGPGKAKIFLAPSNFTSSSALQNIVAPFGASFTGTDMHARGIYQLMLTAPSTDDKETNTFITDKEGLNLVTLTHGAPDSVLGKEFLTWSNRDGVIVPSWITDAGVALVFQGFPDAEGVIRTDVSRARPVVEYMAQHPDGLEDCLISLFKCHPPEVIAKALGWAVACNFKPLFHKAYDKFPLLHVYGAAGSGKSELVLSLLRMFYLDEEPKWLTPSGTPFAFQQLVFGSGSIPIILDEYKPHLGAKENVEKYRALFRDSYNSKPVARGGGSRGKDNFNSLNTTTLSAPVGFISEAVETEPAIMERSVIVGIRKPTPRAASEGLRQFLKYSANSAAMPVLGRYMAGVVLNEWTVPRLKTDFDKMYQWALTKFMMQPEDEENYRSGKLSEEDYMRKVTARSRPIYNSTVALFGLIQLRELIKMIVPQDYEQKYAAHFDTMRAGVYMGMDVVAKTTTPEYIKVIQTLSDMSKFDSVMPYALVEHVEYSLQSMAGKTVLALHVRAAYNKYRTYMRNLGASALYPGDAAFEIALMETPQYIAKGVGTKQREGETILLDLEELVRAGVPAFKGKIS